MMSIQDALCSFLVGETKEQFHEDIWDYEKGEGGGRTRVWEETSEDQVIEKGGVNYSAIGGDELPAAALATMPGHLTKAGFRTTGVSVVIHPHSPLVPTIHMNVRYFEAGDFSNNDIQVWWFGGGIDLTPTYPKFGQIIDFHKGLRDVCQKHGQDHDKYKKTCDEYFYLAHRNECRGVGGIFFDHLRDKPKAELFKFVYDLGMKWIELYSPFLSLRSLPYTPDQRQFQLWRRSRYVEFNLLWDRGTKFGIQSNGRTESILMTMPKTACWKYSYQPPEGTPESLLVILYLNPQDWVNLTEKDELDLIQKLKNKS
jgi:coproporphyrinogen III oxidase